MENLQFCQSCSMPLTGPETLGTNADGSPSQDYCCHCYQNGAFLQKLTMEQMIEICVPFMAEAHHTTAEAAKTQLQEFFPKLKRWQQG